MNLAKRRLPNPICGYIQVSESEHLIKIFEYMPNRRATNPQNFLKGFKGTIITDGYYEYNHIDNVSNDYCWAHVRRKFFDALPGDLKDAPDILAKKQLIK